MGMSRPLLRQIQAIARPCARLTRKTVALNDPRTLPDGRVAAPAFRVRLNAALVECRAGEAFAAIA
jgi:hypothetical protein